jgi:hypothetical protein
MTTEKTKQCQYCGLFTDDLKIAKLKIVNEDCVGYFWLCNECRKEEK